MKSTYIKHPSGYSKNILLFLGLLLTMASCSKSFLEVVPKGKLLSSTVNDYDLMLNNILIYSYNGNAQLYMGDDVTAVESYFTSAPVKTQRCFRWDDDLYDPDQQSDELQSLLSALYIYNKIAGEVKDASGGTDQQKSAIMAEALGGRAWIYFLLVNYYGEPYDPATASADPGFPLLTKADVTISNFSRGTLQETYDFMISDLTTAIAQLPAAVSNRTRMSRPAAEALLGKIYLFMGNPAKALPLFQAAFTDLDNNTGTPIQLYDYNQVLAPGGEFLPVSSYGPNYPLLPNNKESIYARQLSALSAGSNAILMNSSTSALFDPDDWRLKFFTGTYYPAALPLPQGMMRRIGPSNVPFGFVLPDLYLLEAECKARLNDLTGATQDLVTLRSKRMPAGKAPVDPNITADKTLLIHFIIEERIREFALMGHRWFDMRRLSVDPLFSGATYQHVLQLTAGGTTTYSLRPERLTLRLPQLVMAENPGFTNNP